MSLSVRIRETTGKTNCRMVLENPKKPYGPEGYDCTQCGRIHYYKTTHLQLEPDGSVLVSFGVLLELQQMGMPQLEVMNEIKDPPPLTISGKVPARDVRDWRARQDNENRKVWIP